MKITNPLNKGELTKNRASALLHCSATHHVLDTYMYWIYTCIGYLR